MTGRDLARPAGLLLACVLSCSKSEIVVLPPDTDWALTLRIDLNGKLNPSRFVASTNVQHLAIDPDAESVAVLGFAAQDLKPLGGPSEAEISSATVREATTCELSLDAPRFTRAFGKTTRALPRLTPTWLDSRCTTGPLLLRVSDPESCDGLVQRASSCVTSEAQCGSLNAEVRMRADGSVCTDVGSLGSCIVPPGERDCALSGEARLEAFGPDATLQLIENRTQLPIMQHQLTALFSIIATEDRTMIFRTSSQPTQDCGIAGCRFATVDANSLLMIASATVPPNLRMLRAYPFAGGSAIGLLDRLDGGKDLVVLDDSARIVSSFQIPASLVPEQGDILALAEEQRIVLATGVGDGGSRLIVLRVPDLQVDVALDVMSTIRELRRAGPGQFIAADSVAGCASIWAINLTPQRGVHCAPPMTGLQKIAYDPMSGTIVGAGNGSFSGVVFLNSVGNERHSLIFEFGAVVEEALEAPWTAHGVVLHVRGLNGGLNGLTLVDPLLRRPISLSATTAAGDYQIYAQNSRYVFGFDADEATLHRFAPRP